MDKNKIKRAALAGCVDHIRGGDLRGKGRDDAARHYLAGAAAVAKVSGVEIAIPGEDGGYLDVLEALADTTPDPLPEPLPEADDSAAIGP